MGCAMWTTVAHAVRAFTLFLVLAGSVALAQPAEAMRAAHADLKRLPPGIRTHVRYLSLHPHAEKDRDILANVLAGHCNQLSRSPLITRPARVGTLLRVNLKDYAWSTETWEKLTDPYFALVTEIERKENAIWPGGDYKGAYHPAGTKYVRTWQERTAVLAPWLVESEDDKARIAEVLTWTASKMPVVRGDWFMNQSAIQADRAAGYYDWLGIKDEKTFQAIIGADLKKAEAFRFELREAVAISGVTLSPRALSRHDSLGGGYWRSLDFKQAVGDKNPLKIFGRELEKTYDASEQYGHLPNGFWATGLFDRAGKRQDFAPPDIASDGASKSTDRRVHVNASCYRCHADGGLQPIDAWARTLLTPPIELRLDDYEKAVELRQQYLRALEPVLARDKATFEAAVKEATGLTSKEYAAAYGAEWARYEDGRVTAEWAAADLGLTEKEFRERLLLAVKGGYPVDPVVGSFAHEGPRAKAIPMRQWEEAIPAAYAAMKATEKTK